MNKIANNEEVPKKIKFEGLIYTWDKIGYLHYKDDYYRECSFLEGLRVELVLNAEVEIIEDEEEIDIQSIEEIVGNTDVRMNNKEISAEDYFYTITNIVLSINELKNKQNESLKAVKQLDKNIKELR